MKEVIVFDHGNTRLTQVASACGATILPLSAEHISDETRAADDLLKLRGAQLLIVHISDDGWVRLCQNAGMEQVLVRLQQSGFPASQLEQCKALAVRIIKRIDELDENAFRTLVGGFQDESVRRSLRNGFVPDSLRPFIQFAEPNYLTALFILGSGFLVSKLDAAQANQEELSDDFKQALARIGIANPETWHARGLPHDLMKKIGWRKGLGFERGFSTEDCAKLKSAVCEEIGNDGLQNLVVSFLEDLLHGADEEPVQRVVPMMNAIQGYLER